MGIQPFTGEKVKNIIDNKTEQVYAGNHIQLKQPSGPGCPQQITK